MCLGLRIITLQAINDYGNFLLQRPVDHAGYYAKHIVDPMQWTPEDKMPEVAGKAFKLVQRD